MDDTQHQAASVVRGACPHDCPDTCAWQVTVKDGVAVKLVGDPQLSARYPLSLLTSKSALHFLNSSYANLPRHLKAEREPLLEMHPDDAAHRGIVDCDLVRIYNDRGSVKAHVRIGDRVRPGVVSLPSGWWASLSPGGSSANTLTADGLSDWGGGGDFHDTLVEVARPG